MRTLLVIVGLLSCSAASFAQQGDGEDRAFHLRLLAGAGIPVSDFGSETSGRSHAGWGFDFEPCYRLTDFLDVGVVFSYDHIPASGFTVQLPLDAIPVELSSAQMKAGLLHARLNIHVLADLYIHVGVAAGQLLGGTRSEEHTSELQSRLPLVC